MKKFMQAMAHLCLALLAVFVVAFEASSWFVMRDEIMQKFLLDYSLPLVLIFAVFTLLADAIAKRIPEVLIHGTPAWEGAIFSVLGWVMLVGASFVTFKAAVTGDVNIEGSSFLEVVLAYMFSGMLLVSGLADLRLFRNKF